MTLTGTAFAGYNVEEVIGRGGMGVVYRATDLSLERPVALKLIAAELAGDERFRRRFLDESRRAASLDHPAVVPIYEAGETDGQLFIAMRYVEGSDLHTLLRRDGPLAAERALALLAQIAGALDAAHERGLVHRDVKPSNILLDGGGHAYLTDFGVVKRLGGETTELGAIVGTLDYLAPEQIEGGDVDARTDVYALACVLCECLTGTPPFRRETEPETMWAHMREEYAVPPAHPVLAPVLARAFARDPERRYASCRELIEAVAAAGSRMPAGLLRRRRPILVVGVAVLAVTVAAALVVLAGKEKSEPLALSNGVLSLRADATSGSFTEARTAPSNAAVGEGAVWVLNTEDETISRIDPATKAVKRFTAGPRPTDLAAGEGALWIGGNGTGERDTIDVRRVDPRSLKVTGTVKLSRRCDVSCGNPTEGYPGIAAGAGAVWAISRDSRVYRLDAGTGRIMAKVPVPPFTRTLAAGPEGVWLLTGEDQIVRRIDPATNRVADQVPIGSDELAGIAVGGGAVWVTSPQDGLLWRIEPGPRPRTRSIPVGAGVSFVGFGDGAAWTANYMEGTVTRVDARTNAVAKTVAVGAAQALAVGAGSAWVSVASGARGGALPATACSAIEAGGLKPEVLIASDLALAGEFARTQADAIRWVLEDHGFRAGAHVVGYQSCDDSTAQTGTLEKRRCAANANAYARTARVVAVIGPNNSYCAEVEIPLLNRAEGGPVAMVSPTTFRPNLTRGPPLAPTTEGIRGAPGVFYPTGTRNFARVVARADLLGVADAMLARRLGLSHVFLLDPRGTEARATVTEPFRRAASRLGVGIAGSARYDRDAKSYAALADRVARAGADGVVIAGYANSGGGRVLKALRARRGRRLPVMVSEEFGYTGSIREGAGAAAEDLHVASSEVFPGGGSPAEKRFVAGFGDAARRGYALHAAQAAEVVLDAIARSDGTRASVLRALRSTRVRDGVLGSFAFDANGDMTPATVNVVRIRAGARDKRLPDYFDGAQLERTFTVPAELAG